MVVSDDSLVLLAVGRLRMTMSNIIHVYPYGGIADMLQAIAIGLGFGGVSMPLCAITKCYIVQPKSACPQTIEWSQKMKPLASKRVGPYNV